MNTISKLASILGVSVLVALGAQVSHVQKAEACGGFFCNQQQPVDQSAERIIFSQNSDDTVTAAVQILYQGPSEEFAWLLPVSGTPEVGVSSNTAFQRLQDHTDPRYDLEVTVEGECAQPPDYDDGMNNGGAVDAAAGGGSDAGDPSVDVLDEGSVGPYDYTTISVEPGDADPAQAALDWLETNGYDLTEMGPDLIRDYLEDGMNLIAFKLTKNADSGDVRPVTLTYPAELPMIPIKLTAVAAQSDMGVLVWVLGDGRAIPKNYKSLVLNDAAINWFDWRSTYEDVITQAANEANGQGFVTEYAKSATTLEEAVITDSEIQYWEQVNDPDAWDGQHGAMLFDVMRTFGLWDGFRSVVADAIPVPDGATVDDFMNCPDCYFDGNEASIDGFSPSVFLQAMQTEVIDPVIDTQDLLESRPYVTRMYTTLSPPEMTLDPVFDFNTTLDDVSNTHTAQQTIHCSSDVTRWEAPWQVELPSGEVVNGSGRSWPLSAGDELPASREIRQENASGSGETVTDHTADIEAILAAHNDETPISGDSSGDGNNGSGSNNGSSAGSNSDGDSGGGCTAAGGTTPLDAGGLLVVGLGLMVWRRRRD
ncbi:MAG: DUF2330 domain-containing protein [Persicimonas sp.]